MANYVPVQIIAPQAEGDTGASADEVVLTDRDAVALFSNAAGPQGPMVGSRG
jgi:hypothetical protein